jgi:hypothetical protein
LSDDGVVSSDLDVVRSSGLFDAAYYAATHPEVVAAGLDPLEHFCATGWLELRRPRADFDVWWYWTTHLDPASLDTNPFVHWVTEGRAAGLAGLPATTEARPATAPAESPRRICLFATFDRDARVDDHVVRYVTELSRHADVYVLHDGYLPPVELSRFDGIANGAWAIRHDGYDFGSWSVLARDLVGWDVVASYDELLLANDSCYLLRPLDEVFAQMDATAADWWGLQATKGLAKTRDAPSNAFTEPIPMTSLSDGLLDEFEHDAVYDFHVGSYFVAYRRPVLDDPRFRAILDSVAPERGKLPVIQKYEIGLTHFLIGHGYAFATYADQLYPFHPLFSDWHFTLIERGFPLLKKYLLYQNHYDVPDLVEWRSRVAALVPDAPLDVFEADLLRTSPDDRLRRSFAIRRDADGNAAVPTPLEGRTFRRADRQATVREDVWVFPVSPADHRLPASSRAILEEVRRDASVTPVVLSRSRPVDLPGVEVLPMTSPDGQQRLLEAGYVLTDARPRRSVGERLRRDHRVIQVRDGLALRWGGPPQRPAPLGKDGLPTSPWHAVLTASDLDQLVGLGLHHPAQFSQGWRTGIPAHDLLVRPLDELPADIVADVTRLEAELAGRRLVLVVPAYDGPAAYPFSEAELAQLRDWCTRTGSVLGVRQDARDLDSPWARRLESLALDLSQHRYPSTQVVLRAAGVVITDFAGLALDAAVTGTPVISLTHDLDHAGPSLVLDLEHVFPGPVCRSFEELASALERLDEPPTPGVAHLDDLRRRLLCPPPDGASAARVVARVRLDMAAVAT